MSDTSAVTEVPKAVVENYRVSFTTGFGFWMATIALGSMFSLGYTLGHWKRSCKKKKNPDSGVPGPPGVRGPTF